MLEHEQRDLAPDDVERVCRVIADDLEKGPSEDLARNAIDVLCDIAATKDKRFRDIATRTLFTFVERLSDSFEPSQVPFYDRIFARIIERCRRQPGGDDLDRTLRRFGIRDEQDLLARKNRIASLKRTGPVARDAVRRAFLISRVTLGADVAVTSVIAQCVMNAFPNAEVTLIGPAGIRDLFTNIERFETLPAAYDRRGSLLDRLRNWTDLVRILDGERQQLSPDDYIVIDPDSRLTQLGLLPLTEDEDRCYFFESRSYCRPGKERLGQLALEWSSETFGQRFAAHPFVRLPIRDVEFGRGCRRLRGGKPTGVVSFNFGAGGNAMKQLPLDFEVRLALGALRQGYAVVLDKGIGEECARADQIVERLRGAATKIFEANSSNIASLGDLPEDTDALIWQGGAGAFAGLIASTDLYVGYDSAFQHIAAALGVPVIDIFVGADNDRFIDRWTPYSRAPVQAVKVAPPASPSDSLKVVDDILSRFGLLINTRRS